MLRLVAVSLLAVSMMIGCASKDKAAEEKTEKQEAQAEAEANKEAEKEQEAAKENAAAAIGGTVTCTLDKDKRMIEVKADGENRCEVLYTKYDQQQSIASADSDVNHCQKVQERVQSNLENAGFKCQ